MELTKTLVASYNDELTPLAFANIFESNIFGNIINDGYYAESNINGEFIMDTNYTFDYITFSWQGQKRTFTYNEVINTNIVTIEIALNELDEVVISADPLNKNNTLILILLGLISFTVSKL